MIRPVVLIFRPVDAEGSSHAELTAAGCDLIVAEPGQDAATLIREADRVDALVGATFPNGRLVRELLAQHSELRIVAKYSIGVDDVDLGAANELGVLVTHCPTEANWGGVAEGTVAMLLGLLKKLRERDAVVKDGGWRRPELEGTYLGARDDGYPGITFGILGLGRIGRRVAALLAPWRMRVLATDPYVADSAFAEYGVGRVDFESLLESADVLSLHCNLTTETAGIMDRTAFARLKPGAVLINTARGGLVDQAALGASIESGRLAGAALDVFAAEPLPEDAPILSLGDRVLLSPHMVAANRGGTLKAAIPWATDATLAALRGQVPDRVYNGEAVGRWRRRFGGRSMLG